MKNNELLSIRKNCIFCFQKIEKKSVEHLIPKSIGGKLVFPLICGKCNNDLGSIVDRHWTLDCWMKFAKDQLNLSEFNFKSELEVSEKQNKYTIVKLPNGKEQVKPPFTPAGAWRAAAKISYELCAMTIRRQIFRNDFDGVRHFIQTGELPDGQKFDQITLTMGDGFNICRTPYHTGIEPWHRFDFQDMGAFIQIDLLFFNYYGFSAIFKIDIKALKLKTIDLPFRLVQQFRPENRLYFANWDEEKKECKIIGYI